jgi:AraC-like DNA-binding protein
MQSDSGMNVIQNAIYLGQKVMPHSTLSERRVLNLACMGLAEVPVLGRYEYSSAHPGLITHTHPGTVEICYLERGCQTYRAGGREYHLVGGDVFVTAPGEPHDTGGYAEDRGILYWLNLRIPKQGQSMLMLPTPESAALMAKLSALPDRQFAGRSVLKQIFNKIFALCEQPAEPLVRVAIVNELVRCILEVINCAHRQNDSHRSPPIARIMERIRANPEREYSLIELANEASLSLSRFKANFKAQVGQAPHEFLLRCKVDAAKTLLMRRRSVTDTAMDLGFSSSQYFATVFKRFTNQTPIEFRTHGPAIVLRRGSGRDVSTRWKKLV